MPWDLDMLLEDLKRHGVEAVFKGDLLEIKFPNPVITADCFFIRVEDGGVELRYNQAMRYVDIWLPPPAPFSFLRYAFSNVECVFISGNIVRIVFNRFTHVSKEVDID